MFFCEVKTAYRILVLTIFNTHISASFPKLNDFKIRFFVKEVALVTFSCPELTFSRNFANFAFSFWLYSSERKRENF